MNLIIFCVVTLFIIWVSCRPIEQFYGDVPYKDYVTSLCLKDELILIDNLQYSNHSIAQKSSSKYELFKHLLAINCNYQQYNNLSIFLLSAKLSKVEYFLQHRTKLLVFEFTQLTLDFNIFQNITHSLNFIYQHCMHCLPFHVIFQESTQKIFDLSTKLLMNLPKNFHSIFVSNWRQHNSAIHLRPKINGCYRHKTILWPQTIADYQTLKHKDCNLNETSLNVSVNNYMPYCNVHRTPDGQILFGYSMERQFLILSSKQFNFRYNLVDGNQSWGVGINEIWTGVVGHVFYEKTDIAICGITRTLERNHVIDFTRHLLQHAITFLSRSPRRKSNAWFFVHSFSFDIWIYLCISFFGLALLLHGKSGRQSGLTFYLALLYAIAIRQSNLKVVHQISSHSSRLLLGAWFIATIIIFNLYSSNLYGFLAVATYEPPIDTIADLVRAATHDTHTILTLGQSAFTYAFYSATPENPTFYPIGRHMRRHGKAMIEDTVTGLNLMEHSRQYILILPRPVLAYSRFFYTGKKMLHIGEDNLLSQTVGWAFPKRSPLVGSFNLIIPRLRETGFFNHWIGSSGTADLFSNPTDRTTSGECKPFALKSLKSVFIALLFGCSLSLLVFLIEIGIVIGKICAQMID